MPTLKFYGVPKVFAAAMPLIGTFLSCHDMDTSATRFWAERWRRSGRDRFYVKKVTDSKSRRIAGVKNPVGVIHQFFPGEESASVNDENELRQYRFVLWR